MCLFPIAQDACPPSSAARWAAALLVSRSGTGTDRPGGAGGLGAATMGPNSTPDLESLFRREGSHYLAIKVLANTKYSINKRFTPSPKCTRPPFARARKPSPPKGNPWADKRRSERDHWKRPASWFSGRARNRSAWPIQSDSADIVKGWERGSCMTPDVVVQRVDYGEKTKRGWTRKQWLAACRRAPCRVGRSLVHPQDAPPCVTARPGFLG